ncbi:MAG: hypothetical protein H7831_14590 [Magnetococcus sp. WYHC-3]
MRLPPPGRWRHGLLLAALVWPMTWGSCPAQASTPMEMHVRIEGRSAHEYYRNGQRFISGNVGQEYTIDLENHGSERLLCVLSVDGRSVLDGSRASYDGPGYIVPPHGRIHIPGWRLDSSRVARFQFDRADDSYAAQRGDWDNLGVIGCAVFRERVTEWDDSRDDHEDNAVSGPPRRRSTARMTQESDMGTGFGRPTRHAVRRTEFQRSSQRPAEVITIRYQEQRRHGDDDGISRRRDYDAPPAPRRWFDPRHLPHHHGDSPQAFPEEGWVPPPPHWPWR